MKVVVDSWSEILVPLIPEEDGNEVLEKVIDILAPDEESLLRKVWIDKGRDEKRTACFRFYPLQEHTGAWGLDTYKVRGAREIIKSINETIGKVGRAGINHIQMQDNDYKKFTLNRAVNFENEKIRLLTDEELREIAQLPNFYRRSTMFKKIDGVEYLILETHLDFYILTKEQHRSMWWYSENDGKTMDDLLGVEGEMPSGLPSDFENEPETPIEVIDTPLGPNGETMDDMFLDPETTEEKEQKSKKYR